MSNEENYYTQYSGFWLSKKQQKLYKTTTKIRENNQETRRVNNQGKQENDETISKVF